MTFFPSFDRHKSVQTFFKPWEYLSVPPPPPFALLIYLGASHNTNNSKIEKIMINIRFINYSTKNTRWHNPINGIWFFITYSGKIGIPRYFYRFGIFVPSSELFDRVSYSWKASESFVIFESSFIGNTWLYRACCLRFARTLSKEIWISSNEILLELLLYFFY